MRFPASRLRGPDVSQLAAVRRRVVVAAVRRRSNVRRSVSRAETSAIITPFPDGLGLTATAGDQALISLRSVLLALISTLRGLAFSAMGMVNVSTPAS